MGVMTLGVSQQTSPAVPFPWCVYVGRMDKQGNMHGYRVIAMFEQRKDAVEFEKSKKPLDYKWMTRQKKRATR